MQRGLLCPLGHRSNCGPGSLVCRVVAAADAEGSSGTLSVCPGGTDPPRPLCLADQMVMSRGVLNVEVSNTLKIVMIFPPKE